MPSGKHNSPKPNRVLPKAAKKLAEELDKNNKQDTDTPTEPVKEKPKRKNKLGAGPPFAQIDKNIFENLCKILCTQKEIQNVLGHHINTIVSWCEREYGKPFSEVYDHFSDSGRASLRRNQFNLSKSNAAMSIWLGKQWLDQKDNTDVYSRETTIKVVNYKDEELIQEQEQDPENKDDAQ